MKISTVTELNAIYAQLQNRNLPITTMYKLSKFFSALQTDVEFYRNRLSAIIQTYGQRDENGNLIQDADQFKIKPESVVQCQREFDELTNIEVKEPDVKFKLSELEGANLTLEQFNMFLPFIEE